MKEVVAEHIDENIRCSKSLFAACAASIALFVAAYAQLIIKPLQPGSKYSNLVPGFPYVLRPAPTAYHLYPSSHGYSAFACDDVVHGTDFKIAQNISIGFHPHFQVFKFKTTGYMNFNISIEDPETGESKQDQISIFQDGQRTRQRYFTCTNDVCLFEIRSLLPYNEIFIKILTSNFSVGQCQQVQPTQRQYAFNPERDYCSMYHIQQPNKFIVFIPIAQAVNWGVQHNNFLEIYRYSKNQVLPNLVIIAMVSSVIALLNYGVYTYISDLRQAKQSDQEQE